MTVTPGEIFFIDTILSVPGGTFEVSISQSAKISVAVDEVIETEEENPELFNRSETNLWGFPGAARQKWNTSLVLGEGFEVATIENGVIHQRPVQERFNLPELRHFIFDRMGNFYVRGFETRVVDRDPVRLSGVIRFEELKRMRDGLETEYIEARSQAEQSQFNADSIREQIVGARNLFQVSRIAELEELVVSLEEQLRVAENQQRLDAEKFLAASIRQRNVEEEIDRLQSLTVDAFPVQVSPGLGYVLGNRVCLDSPFIINVPKELPELTVTSARFRVVRPFSRSIRFAEAQSVTTGELQFVFENLRLADPNIARITFKLDLLSGSLEEVLLLAVEALNSGEQIVNWEAFSVNGNRLGVSANDTWAFLKGALSISFFREGSRVGLIFEATASGVSIELDNSMGITFDPPGSVLMSDGASNTTLQLGFRPVSAIEKVVGVLEEFNRPVVRSVTETDVVIEDSIESVLTIVQRRTRYFPGVDWELVNQSQIRWYPGRGPASGTTYFVSFRFTRLLRPKEYRLDAGDFLLFVGAQTPVSVDVTYSFFLRREGVLTLDKNGKGGFILSPPSVNPVTPDVPESLLAFAAFSLSADGISLTPLPCRRLDNSLMNSLVSEAKESFFELEQLKKQFERLEADWTGIDGFFDLSDVNLKSTTAAFNPATQTWTSGFEKVDIPVSDSTHHLPFILVPLITQDGFSRRTALTGKFEPRASVFPRASFFNQSGSAKFTPIPPFEIRQNTVGRRVRSTLSQDFFDVTQSFIEGFPLVRGTTPWGRAIEASGEGTIQLSFSGLEPRSPFTLFVDDVPTELGYARLNSNDPLPGKFTLLEGTLFNSPHIIASSTGEVNLTFRFAPSHIGSVAFRIQPRTVNGVPRHSGPPIEVSASVFNNLLDNCVSVAGGMWLDFRNSTALSHADSEGPASPSLVQTFSVDEPCAIGSIDVRLRKAPTGRLRLVLMHFPSREVIDFTEASTLNPSVSGALWTRFQFSVPVALSIGNFAFGFEGTGAEFFTLLDGEQRLGGESLWSEGNLLSIVDGQVIPRESEMLSFILHRANFSPSSSVSLSPVQFGGAANFQAFCLNTRAILPPGTTIDFQFLDATGWKSFQPNQPVPVNSNSAQTRALLSTSNSFVSPVFFGRGASFSVYRSQNRSSELHSRLFEFDFVYRSVEVIAEHFTPPGTEIEIWISAIPENRLIDWGSGTPEWTKLNLTSTATVDGLQKTVFQATNLPDTFGLLRVRRQWLRYKVVFKKAGEAFPVLRRIQVAVRQTLE